MFVFFCVFSAIFWYSLATDIHPVTTENITSMSVTVSIREPEQIEEIYVQYKSSNTLQENPVCALSKSKKIKLCEQIFKLSHYKRLRIHLNKIAFFVSTLTCVEKELKFKSRTDSTDSEVKKEKMYPCYGRHDPVRTSFIEDNYYDKFYVSAGLADDSVMVYIHEYDDEFDWYSVYDYLENIKYTELEDIFIKLLETTAEFELNNKIFSTTNQKELEYIYAREYHSESDPICNLPEEKKVALCQFIFSQLIYEKFFDITINLAAFFIMRIPVEEKPLNIRYSKRYENKLQKMYPCFSRSSRDSINNILQPNYYNKFYVSAGPRENSVFVYYRKLEHETDEKFYLYELFENVYIHDLKSRIVKFEELANESLITKLYIDNLIIIKKDDEGIVPPSNYSERFKKMVEAKRKTEKGKQKFKASTSFKEDDTPVVEPKSILGQLKAAQRRPKGKHVRESGSTEKEEDEEGEGDEEDEDEEKKLTKSQKKKQKKKKKAGKV